MDQKLNTEMSDRVPDKDKNPRNMLGNENSPYLLQHADNPVDWLPWNSEAFRIARSLNKPVFLSIGYSTCHWCHVMEHESFEDVELAKLMNDTFVCVKVDREERPDVDSIYMTVCQMMTGSGGWPLTIIMTPDKKPFFAGTYFPKESRYGRIGMYDLVHRIRDLWTNRREDINQTAEKITETLQQVTRDISGDAMDIKTLEAAATQLSRRYDPQYGGFSHAPKFPTPHNMLFLLRYWKRTGEENILEKVEKTLEYMRRGGMYDHLGFGFHRYSTDEKWVVPHFEKMLYDQALLSMAYIEAFQVTGKQEYRQTAEEIFAYVLRDMTSPEGAFYSAEDADSEGEEGKFYVWSRTELSHVLSENDLNIAEIVFNINKDGNFIEQTAGSKTGDNILHRTQSWKELSTRLNMPEDKLQSTLKKIRDQLFKHRENRVHPFKDDKILTDWNGLMIAALAKGARVLGEPKYADAAKRAINFILTSMSRSDGRLLHRFRDGQSAINGYLDDYAFCIWGLLETYETTFETEYLESAVNLQEMLIQHFWDEKGHGFFLTPDDGEQLLVRTKEIYDGAIPSGNSAAMLNLLKLSRITGNSDWDEKSAELAKAFAGQITQMPTGSTQLLIALDFAVGPANEVVIVGNPQDDETRGMIHALNSVYLPNKVVLFKPTGEKDNGIVRIASFTKNHDSIDGKTTVYVCQDHNCQLPTTDVQKMLELLKIRYAQECG